MAPEQKTNKDAELQTNGRENYRLTVNRKNSRTKSPDQLIWLSTAEVIEQEKVFMYDRKKAFKNPVCEESICGNTPDVEVKNISVKNLIEYADKKFSRLSGRNQPFLAYTDEALEELVQSISLNGIINPLVVREGKNGKYIILSGRNRYRAAKKLGMRSVPAIVKENISDDEAAQILLDSNLKQRQNLKYSEKAYAYRMETEILNRQGKRTDLEHTLCKICTKSDTLSDAGKANGDSRRKVAYYIRLTYLLPGLLKLVDDGIIRFMPAVSLSYLPVEAQSYILKNIAGNHKIRQEHTDRLRELQAKGELTNETIENTFNRETEKEEKINFVVSTKFLKKCPELLNDSDKLQTLFIEFLKKYIERQVS